MCLRQNYERRMYSSTRYRGTHMATPQLNQEGIERLKWQLWLLGQRS